MTGPASTIDVDFALVDVKIGKTFDFLKFVRTSLIRSCDLFEEWLSKTGFLVI